jgi:hypothetical protein
MLPERLTAATVIANVHEALFAKCGGVELCVTGCFKAWKDGAIIFYSKDNVSSAYYYCDKVLARGLLHDIRQLSGVDAWLLWLGYIFQQDGAPAHCSRHMVVYLNTKVSVFIELVNWPDLNPIDYLIGFS